MLLGQAAPLHFLPQTERVRKLASCSISGPERQRPSTHHVVCHKLSFPRHVGLLAPLRAQLKSEAEVFNEGLFSEGLAGDIGDGADLEERANQLREQASILTQQINELYNKCFSNVCVEVPNEKQQQDSQQEERGMVVRAFPQMDEALFAELGRTEPQVLAALLAQKEKEDAAGWRALQAQATTLQLQRSRIENEIAEISNAVSDFARSSAQQDARVAREAAMAPMANGAAAPAVGANGASVSGSAHAGRPPLRVVMMTGFESFNVDLYKRAAARVKSLAPHIEMDVFSDRDILEPGPSANRVAAALENADVFFGSLLFDFDQVEWLRPKIERVPLRFVFESALELMSCTKVGGFSMAGGQQKGPPPAVKKVLSLFGSGREEDKMVGYLSFLKIGPKLLKFIPGQKAADLRNWLTVYSYWNQVR
ncbi:hypothetical protein DUNSADRAFT_12825 [Dunaliella salina]|uniref:magnesium chelatase n=1 Tax=Dunaliella salina TaxID=3046 RepID=A0ABQ7H9N1_DUNSA|nr:hypothetical protein DUNSADRAFT_12825 [Dunaliella salina]|eukprot:KAF5843563.1 hypothetical protein DUNSADRAFT_12825 [Dunaliella salina]